MGEGGDFALAGSGPTEWFYGQHFPYLVNANGPQLTLAVFDDGDFRVSDDNGSTCNGYGGYPNCYSRAVIYQVNESDMVTTMQWQYLPRLYTLWGGSIVTTDYGDIELDLTAPYGAKRESLGLEVTQTSNPQVVRQLDIDGRNAYRAYRIPSL